MDTRRATEDPAGVLDTTSRSPTERNAVDMPGSAAAVESLREMRARTLETRSQQSEVRSQNNWSKYPPAEPEALTC